MNARLLPAITVTKREELALAADPIAYTEMALGRAVGWLKEARGADELREAKAIAASMETFIQQRELGFGRSGFMVGDIVGGAHEAVKRQDRRAVARRDEDGSDGKILVAMALAGLKLCDIAHARNPVSAWARPFHIPPLPRQNWIAESRVKAA